MNSNRRRVGRSTAPHPVISSGRHDMGLPTHSTLISEATDISRWTCLWQCIGLAAMAFLVMILLLGSASAITPLTLLRRLALRASPVRDSLSQPSAFCSSLQSLAVLFETGTSDASRNNEVWQATLDPEFAPVEAPSSSPRSLRRSESYAYKAEFTKPRHLQQVHARVAFNRTSPRSRLMVQCMWRLHAHLPLVLRQCQLQPTAGASLEHVHLQDLAHGQTVVRLTLRSDNYATLQEHTITLALRHDTSTGVPRETVVSTPKLRFSPPHLGPGGSPHAPRPRLEQAPNWLTHRFAAPGTSYSPTPEPGSLEEDMLALQTHFSLIDHAELYAQLPVAFHLWKGHHPDGDSLDKEASGGVNLEPVPLTENVVNLGAQQVNSSESENSVDSKSTIQSSAHGAAAPPDTNPDEQTTLTAGTALTNETQHASRWEEQIGASVVATSPTGTEFIAEVHNDDQGEGTSPAVDTESATAPVSSSPTNDDALPYNPGSTDQSRHLGPGESLQNAVAPGAATSTDSQLSYAYDVQQDERFDNYSSTLAKQATNRAMVKKVGEYWNAHAESFSDTFLADASAGAPVRRLQGVRVEGEGDTLLRAVHQPDPLLQDSTPSKLLPKITVSPAISAGPPEVALKTSSFALPPFEIHRLQAQQSRTNSQPHPPPQPSALVYTVAERMMNWTEGDPIPGVARPPPPAPLAHPPWLGGTPHYPRAQFTARRPPPHPVPLPPPPPDPAHTPSKPPPGPPLPHPPFTLLDETLAKVLGPEYKRHPHPVTMVRPQAPPNLTALLLTPAAPPAYPPHPPREIPMGEPENVTNVQEVYDETTQELHIWPEQLPAHMHAFLVLALKLRHLSFTNVERIHLPSDEDASQSEEDTHPPHGAKQRPSHVVGAFKFLPADQPENLISAVAGEVILLQTPSARQSWVPPPPDHMDEYKELLSNLTRTAAAEHNRTQPLLVPRKMSGEERRQARLDYQAENHEGVFDGLHREISDLVEFGGIRPTVHDQAVARKRQLVGRRLLEFTLGSDATLQQLLDNLNLDADAPRSPPPPPPLFRRQHAHGSVQGKRKARAGKEGRAGLFDTIRGAEFAHLVPEARHPKSRRLQELQRMDDATSKLTDSLTKEAADAHDRASPQPLSGAERQARRMHPPKDPVRIGQAAVQAMENQLYSGRGRRLLASATVQGNSSNSILRSLSHSLGMMRRRVFHGLADKPSLSDMLNTLKDRAQPEEQEEEEETHDGGAVRKGTRREGDAGRHQLQARGSGVRGRRQLLEDVGADRSISGLLKSLGHHTGATHPAPARVSGEERRRRRFEHALQNHEGLFDQLHRQISDLYNTGSVAMTQHDRALARQRETVGRRLLHLVGVEANLNQLLEGLQHHAREAREEMDAPNHVHDKIGRRRVSSGKAGLFAQLDFQQKAAMGGRKRALLQSDLEDEADTALSQALSQAMHDRVNPPPMRPEWWSGPRHNHRSAVEKQDAERAKKKGLFEQLFAEQEAVHHIPGLGHGAGHRQLQSQLPVRDDDVRGLLKALHSHSQKSREAQYALPPEHEGLQRLWIGSSGRALPYNITLQETYTRHGGGTGEPLDGHGGVARVWARRHRRRLMSEFLLDRSIAGLLQSLSHSENAQATARASTVDSSPKALSPPSVDNTHTRHHSGAGAAIEVSRLLRAQLLRDQERAHFPSAGLGKDRSGKAGLFLQTDDISARSVGRRHLHQSTSRRSDDALVELQASLGLVDDLESQDRPQPFETRQEPRAQPSAPVRLQWTDREVATASQADMRGRTGPVHNMLRTLIHREEAASHRKSHDQELGLGKDAYGQAKLMDWSQGLRRRLHEVYEDDEIKSHQIRGRDLGRKHRVTVWLRGEHVAGMRTRKRTLLQSDLEDEADTALSQALSQAMHDRVAPPPMRPEWWRGPRHNHRAAVEKQDAERANKKGLFEQLFAEQEAVHHIPGLGRGRSGRNLQAEQSFVPPFDGAAVVLKFNVSQARNVDQISLRSFLPVEEEGDSWLAELQPDGILILVATTHAFQLMSPLSILMASKRLYYPGVTCTSAVTFNQAFESEDAALRFRIEALFQRDDLMQTKMPLDLVLPLRSFVEWNDTEFWDSLNTNHTKVGDKYHPQDEATLLGFRDDEIRRDPERQFIPWLNRIGGIRNVKLVTSCSNATLQQGKCVQPIPQGELTVARSVFPDSLSQGHSKTRLVVQGVGSASTQATVMWVHSTLAVPHIGGDARYHNPNVTVDLSGVLHYVPEEHAFSISQYISPPHSPPHPGQGGVLGKAIPPAPPNPPPTWPPAPTRKKSHKHGIVFRSPPLSPPPRMPPPAPYTNVTEWWSLTLTGSLDASTWTHPLGFPANFQVGYEATAQFGVKTVLEDRTVNFTASGAFDFAGKGAAGGALCITLYSPNATSNVVEDNELSGSAFVHPIGIEAFVLIYEFPKNLSLAVLETMLMRAASRNASYSAPGPSSKPVIQCVTRPLLTDELPHKIPCLTIQYRTHRWARSSSHGGAPPIPPGGGPGMAIGGRWALEREEEGPETLGWQMFGSARVPLGSEIDVAMRALDEAAAPRAVFAHVQGRWKRNFTAVLAEWSDFSGESPSNFSAAMNSRGWTQYLRAAKMQEASGMGSSFARNRGILSFHLATFAATTIDLEARHWVAFQSIHKLPYILAEGRVRLHHPRVLMHSDVSGQVSFSMEAVMLVEMKTSTLQMDVRGEYHADANSISNSMTSKVMSHTSSARSGGAWLLKGKASDRSVWESPVGLDMFSVRETQLLEATITAEGVRGLFLNASTDFLLGHSCSMPSSVLVHAGPQVTDYKWCFSSEFSAKEHCKGPLGTHGMPLAGALTKLLRALRNDKDYTPPDFTHEVFVQRLRVAYPQEAGCKAELAISVSQDVGSRPRQGAGFAWHLSGLGNVTIEADLDKALRQLEAHAAMRGGRRSFRSGDADNSFKFKLVVQDSSEPDRPNPPTGMSLQYADNRPLEMSMGRLTLSNITYIGSFDAQGSTVQNLELKATLELEVEQSRSVVLPGRGSYETVIGVWHLWGTAHLPASAWQSPFGYDLADVTEASMATQVNALGMQSLVMDAVANFALGDVCIANASLSAREDMPTGMRVRHWCMTANIHVATQCISQTRGPKLTLHAALQAFGRTLSRNQSYTPPMGLEQLDTDELRVRFNAAGTSCSETGMAEADAGAQGGWSVSGSGRLLAQSHHTDLGDMMYPHLQTKVESRQFNFHVFVPDGSDLSDVATLGMSYKDAKPILLSDDRARILQPVFTVEIDAQALTNPTMHFNSLMMDFNSQIQSPPLHVHGQAIFSGDSWTVASAALAKPVWRRPLGMEFVTVTRLQASTSVSHGALQALEVLAEAELQWSDMCGLSSSMQITAKPNLEDAQFCLEARWDAADVQCRQAPPFPGVPPPTIPPAPPPPGPPVPEAPPAMEGKALRRWQRASHAKMMRDIDAANQAHDVDEAAVPPAPPPPSPPPRAPAGAMAAPQLNVVLRQIVLAATGDQAFNASSLLGWSRVPEFGRFAHLSPACKDDVEPAVNDGNQTLLVPTRYLQAPKGDAAEAWIVGGRLHMDPGSVLGRQLEELHAAAMSATKAGHIIRDSFYFRLWYPQEPAVNTSDAQHLMRLDFEYSHAPELSLSHSRLSLLGTSFSSRLEAGALASSPRLSTTVHALVGRQVLVFPAEGRFDQASGVWRLSAAVQQPWDDQLGLGLGALSVHKEGRRTFRGEVNRHGVQLFELDVEAKVELAGKCAVYAEVGVRFSGSHLAVDSLIWCLNTSIPQTCKATADDPAELRHVLNDLAQFDNHADSTQLPEFVDEVQVQSIGPMAYSMPECRMPPLLESSEGARPPLQIPVDPGWTVMGTASVAVGGSIDSLLSMLEGSLAHAASHSLATNTTQHHNSLLAHAGNKAHREGRFQILLFIPYTPKDSFGASHHNGELDVLGNMRSDGVQEDFESKPRSKSSFGLKAMDGQDYFLGGGRLALRSPMLVSSLEKTDITQWALNATMEASLAGSLLALRCTSDFAPHLEAWQVRATRLVKPWEAPLGMNFLRIDRVNVSATLNSNGVVSFDTMAEATMLVRAARNDWVGGDCSMAVGLTVHAARDMGPLAICLEGSLTPSEDCDSASTAAREGVPMLDLLNTLWHANSPSDDVLTQPSASSSLLDAMHITNLDMHLQPSTAACASVFAEGEVRCCSKPGGSYGGWAVHGLFGTWEHGAVHQMLQALQGSDAELPAKGFAFFMRFSGNDVDGAEGAERVNSNSTGQGALDRNALRQCSIVFHVVRNQSMLSSQSIHWANGKITLVGNEEFSIDNVFAPEAKASFVATMHIVLAGSSLELPVMGAYLYAGEGSQSAQTHDDGAATWRMLGSAGIAPSAESWSPDLAQGLVSVQHVTVAVEVRGRAVREVRVSAAVSLQVSETCSLKARLLVNSSGELDQHNWCLVSHPHNESHAQCKDAVGQVGVTPRMLLEKVIPSYTHAPAYRSRPNILFQVQFLGMSVAHLSRTTCHASVSTSAFLLHQSSFFSPSSEGWLVTGKMRARHGGVVHAMLIAFGGDGANKASHVAQLQIPTNTKKSDDPVAARLLVRFRASLKTGKTDTIDVASKVQLSSAVLGMSLSSQGVLIQTSLVADAVVEVAEGHYIRFQVASKQPYRRDGGFDANSTWELEGPMTLVHRSNKNLAAPRALEWLGSATSSRLWVSLLAGKLQNLEVSAHTTVALTRECTSNADFALRQQLSPSRNDAANERDEQESQHFIWRLNTSFPLGCLETLLKQSRTAGDASKADVGVEEDDAFATRTHELVQSVGVEPGARMEVMLSNERQPGSLGAAAWNGIQPLQGMQIVIQEATVRASSPIYNVIRALGGDSSATSSPFEFNQTGLSATTTSLPTISKDKRVPGYLEIHVRAQAWVGWPQRTTPAGQAHGESLQVSTSSPSSAPTSSATTASDSTYSGAGSTVGMPTHEVRRRALRGWTADSGSMPKQNSSSSLHEHVGHLWSAPEADRVKQSNHRPQDYESMVYEGPAQSVRFSLSNPDSLDHVTWWKFSQLSLEMPLGSEPVPVGISGVVQLFVGGCSQGPLDVSLQGLYINEENTVWQGEGEALMEGTGAQCMDVHGLKGFSMVGASVSFSMPSKKSDQSDAPQLGVVLQARMMLVTTIMDFQVIGVPVSTSDRPFLIFEGAPRHLAFRDVVNLYALNHPHHTPPSRALRLSNITLLNARVRFSPGGVRATELKDVQNWAASGDFASGLEISGMAGVFGLLVPFSLTTPPNAAGSDGQDVVPRRDYVIKMDLGLLSAKQEVNDQLEAASTRVRNMLPIESTVYPDVVAWVRNNPLFQRVGWFALAPRPTSVILNGVSLRTGTASLLLDVHWMGASRSVSFDIALERLEEPLEDVVYDSLASLLPECIVDHDCEGSQVCSHGNHARDAAGRGGHMVDAITSVPDWRCVRACAESDAYVFPLGCFQKAAGGGGCMHHDMCWSGTCQFSNGSSSSETYQESDQSSAPLIGQCAAACKCSHGKMHMGPCASPNSTDCLACYMHLGCECMSTASCQNRDSSSYCDQIRGSMENLKCAKCHSSCATCTGPRMDECTACIAPWSPRSINVATGWGNKTTRTPLETTACHECDTDYHCLPGQYCAMNNALHQCVPCHDSCSMCYGPKDSDCTECGNGMHLYTGFTGSWCYPCTQDFHCTDSRYCDKSQGTGYVCRMRG